MIETPVRRTVPNRNPATGALLWEIPCATASEIRDAVDRARSASSAWAAESVDDRCRRLERAAAAMGERSEELATLITGEMGKPLRDARREVQGWVSHTAEVCAEVRESVRVETIDTEDSRCDLVRDPHGVVAAIAPWNFPVAMPLSMLLPALGTGNTVVFKPSEHVPGTGARLAEIFASELPEGVLQCIQGDGEVGAALVDAEVDMVAFVGSRATGERIMRSASAGLKRLVLELGGNDPLVVFADADLDEAADCAVRHGLRNTGQVCCSVERIYVEDSIVEAFTERVLEKAKAWSHGDGMEEGVRMGPLVSEEQRRKVEAHVRDAESRGARVLLGGVLPDGDGWFYPSTVLEGIDHDWPIAREETFGPVVGITRFSGEESEAIRLANDTPYGLGANVYTGDLDRGLRVARGIRSGQVGVNRYLSSAPGTPWVGARQSGFGFLGGIEGHRQFTSPKSIARPHTGSSETRG